jgi:methylglutaconyl-CoA hydratase
LPLNKEFPMNDFQTIQLETDPRGFATLWLNRPEKNNAFNAQMIRELTAAIKTLGEDDSLRFLLLRGRGKHFSAGADLAWMQESAHLNYHANLEDSQRLGELMYSLQQLRLPTMAVVQGAAYGGAVGLIACCDMAIGAESARVCLSEVRVGLMPAVISPFVVHAIGRRATRRYALSAEAFDGERARVLGLFAECYAEDTLDAAVEQWIEQWLLNSPQAMAACKELLNEVGHGALSPALRRHTESAIARIRISEEGQEGLKAFLEKRKPNWQSQ